MPSSHLRMEEATSVNASKSTTNGFERSEVEDELDNFVLQIDENEINKEIKASELVEDLAIDVLKQKVQDKEEDKLNKPQIHLPLKTCTNEEKVECEINEQQQVDLKTNDIDKLEIKIKEELENSDVIKQEDCSEFKEETDIKLEIEEEHIDESSNNYNHSELSPQVHESDSEVSDNNLNKKYVVNVPEQNGFSLEANLEGKVRKQSESVSENVEDVVKGKAEAQPDFVSRNLEDDLDDSAEDYMDCVSEILEDDVESKAGGQPGSLERVTNQTDASKNVKDDVEKMIPGQSGCVFDNEENSIVAVTNSESIGGIPEETKEASGCVKEGLNEKLSYEEEKQETMDKNGCTPEDLETVDKELDSLLNVEKDAPEVKSDNASEPMDLDLTIDEVAAVKEEIDSDNDCRDPLSLHSSQPLRDMNPSFCGIFTTDKLEKRSSKSNNDANCTDTKVEDSCETKKQVEIGLDSSKDLEVNLNSEKRIKREADNETSNKKKRVKLDNGCQKRSYDLKKKLEAPYESNECKKIKKEPDLELGKDISNDSVESNKNNSNGTAPDKTADETSSDEANANEISADDASADESGEINVQLTLDEIKNLKDKIIHEKLAGLSNENIKEIMEGRTKLFGNYFEGKIDIPVNRFVLEEMVMTQIIEFIAYKSEVGQLRQKCRVLESEQIRMNQMVYSLKRQAENAKLIIKKLIDEKINNRNWTHTAIPLKVTRSVGLQVCTCGSMTIRSKYCDRDRKTGRNEKCVTKESATVTRSSVQNNNNASSRVGSIENKENISSNIERDSGNNDDVVIISVTENNKSTPSNINKDNKKTVEAAKNGIVCNGPVTRKSVNAEHTTNNPHVSKTVPTSNGKNPVIENSQLQNEASKTDKTEAEIIDLTDKEESAYKSETSSKPPSSKPTSSKTIVTKPPTTKPQATKPPATKSTATNMSSEQLTTGMSDKTNNALSSNTLLAVNGAKKTVAPTSIAVKKPSDISAPAADLVNSYDHLPKYPASPKYPPNVTKPPRPILRIGKNTSGKQGIMLSWNFEGIRNPPNIEEYQLYAFQESKTSEKLKTDTWKKVGDIKALPLPMACFLTQFVEGHKYHFIVRAVDAQKRVGDFSLPGSIILHAAGQPPSAS